VNQAGLNAETAAIVAPVIATAPNSRIVIAPKIETPRKTVAVDTDGDQKLTTPQQRIIDAIAWMESINLYKPQRSTIAFLARYSLTASSFTNPLGNLRGFGFIDYPSPSEAIALPILFLPA
jgi:hypothetical protein